MKVFHGIAELRAALKVLRQEGKSVGLVPTMGALHPGHLSLLSQSVAQNDVSVASIFVNPIQFNNPEDLEKYPRREEEDLEQLRLGGCDFVFMPTPEEMYRDKSSQLNMSFGHLEKVLEGAFRPGHFSGVGVVVSKLFNIVQPDRAYFGQKDLQQLAVIKKLTFDLNFPVEIVAVPIMRETNGLAMSSRNLRLTPQERDVAAQLYQSMEQLKANVLEGQSITEAIRGAVDRLKDLDNVELEYMEAVESDTMRQVTALDAGCDVSLCAAAYVSGVRIIDNLYLTS
ncbi:pantoate--beta-alanine ligase [Reichenbachiella sp. 5M10]|uniref:pantoate--beta-alanine ligase n=1 Tax=Reichenbachiella sp. 5M10 TaxID=1889772 RepID=UPI000C161B8A|nr:pantoate--beta-alanine ligase [Reichenbachiella sp. 5M10]PIB36677.1 pantoate--beta-alanine ligase [Reichenbachiella sp. 5M10]